MFHTWSWGSGMGFGWIFWLIIIGIIVWLLVSQSRNNRARSQINPGSESPMDILKKRYAKGEINKEQFDRMKEDLK